MCCGCLEMGQFTILSVKRSYIWTITRKTSLTMAADFIESATRQTATILYIKNYVNPCRDEFILTNINFVCILYHLQP